MALDALNQVDIIEVMENFIQVIRPPEEIRNKVDVNYKIENQSVVLFEIRHSFLNPNEKIESNFAKATFSKSKKNWSVYWLQSDLKWHLYTPHPQAEHLKTFVALVKEDKHNCFRT